MAAKAPKAQHTAGIFSDMTVDGPEIGTLVVIVDRARNLPNRKKIGKQDPYCAARLGKEAKKTEVDKRGGQTPKWDQELRFVVHDSADYYQLKVSVFNDDKKTELIGETWVSLEAVVVPGGGQNDLWHNLNCKGKYAGEIRIELTYYDTRPKEEKPVVEARREGARHGEDGEREAVGGPRQLKQFKRRPVPEIANGHHAEDMMPDHAQPHPHNEVPREYRHPAHPAPNPMDPNSLSHGQSNIYYQQPQHHPLPNRRAPSDAPAIHHSTPPRAAALVATPSVSPLHRQSSRYEIQELATENDYVQDVPPPPPAHGSQHASPGASPGMPNLPHSHSAPPVVPSYDDSRQMRLLEATTDYRERTRYQPPHMEDEESLSSHVQQDDEYHSIAPPHHSHDDIYGSGNGTTYSPQDELPPPPPAHRSSGNQMTLYRQPQEDGLYDEAPSPAPLNIANGRGYSPNHQNDPSSLEHYQSQHDGYALQPASRVNSQSTSVSTHTYGQSYHSRQSSDALVRTATRESTYGMPASLIPGYNPNLTQELPGSPVADAGAFHSALYQEDGSHHGSPRQRGDSDVDSPGMYQDLGSTHISHTDRSPALYQDPLASYHPHSQRQYNLPQQEVRPASSHSSTRRQSLLQQEVPLPPVSTPDHRRAAPMIKPRPISPDTRITPRKSVSPQPQPPPQERRLSGIPFSPDSYDALNPNMAAASSINEPSAQYQTPEQTKEAFRQRQREAKRGGADAPIYGADGRLIDPSDHLPADTWAPEPERKQPVKKETPRPNSRSRPMPHGAQPMPSPGQQRGLRTSPTPARPVSAITPTYAHGPLDPQTPSSATRNRLQKKSRHSMSSPAHTPNSSPVGTPPYSGNGTPRSIITPSEGHPLREHENYGNYGYGNKGSPRYGAGVYNSQDYASADQPPPIPSKTALGGAGGYREDDSSALEEELRRIDIGSGSGGGRLVRRRGH
ncbi:MAG: hypothetical protein M1840_004600 [Geoglossum simile]|nr:MAG: hypothetical protein M1840_004600 [Geoglossum simile]